MDYIQKNKNSDFIKILENFNAFLLFAILLLLIIYSISDKSKIKNYLVLLEILFVVFLVFELSIKFFFENEKEFLKKHWLEILSLLPIIVLLRTFYLFGIIRSEKEIEATSSIIHSLERVSKEHKLYRIYRVIQFLERRPVVIRAAFRLILNLKKFFFIRRLLKKRKSAFSLDIETIIKLILLVLFLIIIVLILIKLKDSKLIFFLKNF